MMILLKIKKNYLQAYYLSEKDEWFFFSFGKRRCTVWINNFEITSEKKISYDGKILTRPNGFDMHFILLGSLSKILGENVLTFASIFNSHTWLCTTCLYRCKQMFCTENESYILKLPWKKVYLIAHNRHPPFCLG